MDELNTNGKSPNPSSSSLTKQATADIYQRLDASIKDVVYLCDTARDYPQDSWGPSFRFDNMKLGVRACERILSHDSFFGKEEIKPYLLAASYANDSTIKTHTFMFYHEGIVLDSFFYESYFQVIQFMLVRCRNIFENACGQNPINVTWSKDGPEVIFEKLSRKDLISGWNQICEIIDKSNPIGFSFYDEFRLHLKKELQRILKLELTDWKEISSAIDDTFKEIDPKDWPGIKIDEKHFKITKGKYKLEFVNPTKEWKLFYELARKKGRTVHRQKLIGVTGVEDSKDPSAYVERIRTTLNQKLFKFGLKVITDGKGNWSLAEM